MLNRCRRALFFRKSINNNIDIVLQRVARRFSSIEIESSEMSVEPLLGEGAIEHAVGICAYANNAPGFQGILKQRYSDFVVREVNLSGDVLALRSMTGHDLENKHFVENNSATLISKSPIDASDSNAPAVDVSLKVDELIANIQEVVTTADVPSTLSEELSTLKDFLIGAISNSDQVASSLVSVACPAKTTRTQLHSIFRGAVGHVIETDTVNDPVTGIQRIRLFLRKQLKGQNKQSQKQEGGRAAGGSDDMPRFAYRAKQWPSTIGDYLKFTLVKENVDTMSAASIVAKNLRIGRPSDALQYAGTKDKRAITVQECTMYRRKPTDVAKLNRFNSPPILKFGDFSYCEKPLILGALKGNRFTIALRNVSQSDDVIAASCGALQESGFINFFGLQRFGVGAALSHKIGLTLLQADWRKAVELMFSSREGDKIDVVNAKRAFLDGRFADVVQLLPYQMSSERAVAEVLMHQPNDFQSAYNCVPRNTRVLCAHAYQSAIWNRSASQRIRLFGLNVVPGDLVAVSADILADNTELVTVEDGGNTAEADSVEVADSANPSIVNYSAGVHIVTEADIIAGTYSIRDVILPLVGSESIMPTHDVGKYILEQLSLDGLCLESFSRCPSQYRSRGAYRKLIQFPEGFEYCVVTYNHVDDDLVETELTSMRKTPRTREPDSSQVQELVESTICASSLPDKPLRLELPHDQIPACEGQLRAAILRFTLPPGTYATMMLRELTKESTHQQYQAQLTAIAAGISDREHGISSIANLEPSVETNSKDDAGDEGKDLQSCKRTRIA